MEEKKINNKFEHVETMLKNVIKYVDFLKEEIVVDMLTTEYNYEHSSRKILEEENKILEENTELIKLLTKTIEDNDEEIERLKNILKSNNISF